MRAAISVIGLLFLSGQQAEPPETPKITDSMGGMFAWIPPEPEAEFGPPIRKDGRIIYTLSLRDDWSCAPMSNWSERTLTAIQLVCVKAEPKEKK